MSRVYWLMKKNRLCGLVKLISDRYGGDDIEWLREYCRELIEAWESNLEAAVECFADIDQRTAWMDRRVWHGKKAEGHGRAAAE